MSMSAYVAKRTLLYSWCGPRRKPPRKTCCVHIKTPPDRPDLATYSQEEQFALGLVPTWNSPDILTHHRLPYALLKEPTVKIRNLSSTASAVNALVHVWTFPVGIGTQKTPLASRMINLAPLQEVTLAYPLPQALLDGDQRIGVRVVTEHPHDKNLLNSRASQSIVTVHTSQVGRTFQQLFPVLNFSSAARQLTLSVLPTELNAGVSPPSRNFAPFEQIQATIDVQVPNALHGTPQAVLYKEVSVVGRGPGGVMIDGLTFIVGIDN